MLSRSDCSPNGPSEEIRLVYSRRKWEKIEVRSHGVSTRRDERVNGSEGSEIKMRRKKTTAPRIPAWSPTRSEEHTSELQSQ